jgi:hypothetical protein
VIKNSLFRKSLDNVTIVIISFENFERIYQGNESKVSDSTMLSNEKSTRNDSQQKSISGNKKKAALVKTTNSRLVGVKEKPKHRRVDSGGKRANAKILEHIQTRKRTNSQKEGRTKSDEKDQKLSTSEISKVKQSSYSNFSHHFNYANEPSKTKIAPKVTTKAAANPIYKRMIPPSKCMTSKNQDTKNKKFTFEL